MCSNCSCIAKDGIWMYSIHPMLKSCQWLPYLPLATLNSVSLSCLLRYAAVCSNCSIMMIRYSWGLAHLKEHRKLALDAKFHFSRPQIIWLIIEIQLFRAAIEKTKPPIFRLVHQISWFLCDVLFLESPFFYIIVVVCIHVEKSFTVERSYLYKELAGRVDVVTKRLQLKISKRRNRQY